MKGVPVLFVICLFLSCDNKTKLGQYVYEDDMGVSIPMRIAPN